MPVQADPHPASEDPYGFWEGITDQRVSFHRFPVFVEHIIMFALTRSLLRGAELHANLLRALPSTSFRSFADAAEEKIVSCYYLIQRIESSEDAGNDDRQTQEGSLSNSGRD